MTPAQTRLLSALMRRASLMTPELAAAILVGFQVLRDNLSDADFERAIDLGYAEQVVAQIITNATWQAAMAPVRDQIRRGILQSVTYVQRTLTIPPSTVRTVSVVSFDYLSPNTVTAIRELESRVMTDLELSTREMVRSIVQAGIEQGVNPRMIARNIRPLLGLGEQQAQEVLNFRDALSGANGRSITDYTLRNRTVDRLLSKGPLTPAQIDRYTEAYRARRIAQNAESIARTASLDSLKLAQRLAWQQAIADGRVDAGELIDTWHTTMDGREREAHAAMHLKTKRFDEPWIVPGVGAQDYPGQDEYNCRCVSFTKLRIRGAQDWRDAA